MEDEETRWALFAKRFYGRMSRHVTRVSAGYRPRQVRASDVVVAVVVVVVDDVLEATFNRSPLYSCVAEFIDPERSQVSASRAGLALRKDSGRTGARVV